MDSARRCLPVLAVALWPAWAHAGGDYVGVLRPSAKVAAIAIPEPGFYWLAASFSAIRPGLDLASDGPRLKLGYRYSRFLAVETGFADPGEATRTVPFPPASSRGRGFSMDTVGTWPLWAHGSLYGRFGAWRAAAGPSLLMGEVAQRPGAGLRYGLGLKYDLTPRVGLQAEMERFSPLDRWGPRDADTDQVTFGVTWRF